MQNHVDLIKCQPVFYKSFVSCKEYCYKFLIELNQFSVLPASVLFGQMNRAIKMCNCNKWLNSVFVAFFKYIFIELKFAQDHEGNDQSIQADTFGKTYEDEGFTKN